MASEDALIRTAMLSSYGPPSEPGPVVEGTENDRQALLKELARPLSATNTPQMRAALQRTYDVTFGGKSAPPAVASSMRDGFPDAGGGGGTPMTVASAQQPAANDPWATPLQGAGGGGAASDDPWATPLDMKSAPPQPGVLARAAQVYQDPDGGLLPAVGSVVQHVLGGDSGPSKSGGVGATLADVGRKLVVGVNDLGSSAVGLGSLATGGLLGEALQRAGYQPATGDAIINGFNSEAQQRSDANVGQAQGFVGKLTALAVNPRAVLGSVAEMVPGLAALGVSGATAAGAVVRAALPEALEAATAAGLTGADATAFAAKQIAGSVRSAAQVATAGTLGAQTAGSVAAAGQEAGQSYGDYAPAALLAGLGTVALSYGSKVAANALGVGDLATDLAGAASKTSGGALAAGGKELIKGAAENAGFSGISGAATNVATGQPWDTNLGGSIAEGAATGGLVSGLHGAISHTGAPAADVTPPTADVGDAALSAAVHPMTGAVDAYLRAMPSEGSVISDIRNAPTVDDAITAMDAHSSSASALLAAAAAERDNTRSTNNAIASLVEPTPAPDLTPAAPEAAPAPAASEPTPVAKLPASAAYADLTPMDERTAQGRLTAMRGMQQAAGDETGLNVVPHPDGSGRFAIGRVLTEPARPADEIPPKPVAEATAPTPTDMEAGAPPKSSDVVAAMKVGPALRTPEQRITLDAATRSYSPEDMTALQKRATAPFTMTAAEKVRLSDLRASEARGQADEQVPASVDHAQAEPSAFSLTPEGAQMRADAAKELNTGTPSLAPPDAALAGAGREGEQVVRTNTGTLPDQSQAKNGELSKQSFKVVQQLARVFGKRLVVYEGSNKNDGYINRGDSKTIYLNRTSSVPHLVVFGHELLHTLRIDNPAGYEALRNSIGLKEGANTDVAGIRGSMEEVTADMLGNRFKDPAFWADTFRQILKSGDPGTGRNAAMKLGATVTRVVRKLTKALGGMAGFETDKMVTDLDAVRKAATEALAGYAKDRYADAKALDAETRSEEPTQISDKSPQADEAPVSAKTDTQIGQAPTREEKTAAAGAAARAEMGMRFSEARGPIEPDDVQSKATDKDGNDYDLTLHREMLGDRLHSVYVKAEDADGNHAGMVDFNVRPDGKLSAGIVKTEEGSQRKGVGEMLYRAAQKAGYEIAGSGTQTEAGKKFVASLRDKGVITASEQRLPTDLSKLPSDRIKAMREQLGDDYVGSGMSHDEFHDRLQPLVAAEIAAKQREDAAAPVSGLSEVHPGFTQIPEGTRVRASHGTSVKNEMGTVVGQKILRTGAEMHSLPVVKFDEGGNFPGVPRTVLPGDIHEVYKPRLASERRGDEDVEPKGSALLNVGLDVSHENGGGKLTPDEVKAAIAERGAEVTDHTIHQSGTEPTMVARLNRPLEPDELHGLSARLRQDAIAQRSAEGTALLAGPKAEDWGGAYNPDYFLRMDGRADAEHPDAAKAEEAITASRNRRDELNPDVVQTLGKHIRNLAPDERMRLRGDTAQKLVDTIAQLPSSNEMAAVAFAGRAKRGWYAHSAAAMEHVFGPDAPRFAALLAALSPQTGVETNLKNALTTWKNWIAAGRPTDRESILDIMGASVEGSKGKGSVLPAWENNSFRALSAEDTSTLKLSGPKVNSFMKNLVGHTDEVTNDTWMANYALVSQKIFAGTGAMDPVAGEKLGQKSPGYMAMSAQVRAAAKALTKYTGEEWTPAEVQETIWSWAKTLYESGSVDKSAAEIVRNKELTNELINSTPDFRTLFHTDANERILRDAGYGDELSSLRGRGDLGGAEPQEPGAVGQTAPFAPDAQARYELRAAQRLDALRARGNTPADEVVASASRIVDDNSDREYTPEQKAAFANTGRTVDVPTLKERAAAIRKDLGARVRQGLVDQFAPIKELGGSGYLLARLSKGAAGAFDAFLNHGKLSLSDGVYDADTSGGVIDRVFKPLGNESGDFLWWIAGNRAERLTAEGRESLFTADDISAYKSLDKGLTKNPYTLSNGEVTRDRSKIYPDALRQYNEFNRNALDMAEQSGLIDAASRRVWENEMYVPFYRVAEDQGGFLGNKVKDGLVRQQAFQKLKGGKDKLNSDLLQNTLQNWSHLIDASAKNRAARATLEAAAALGAATPGDGKKSVWYLDGGEKKSYEVSDPHLLAAISSLEAVNAGPVMKALSTFKHWMTVGATASPAFKIRHLIRGSMTAMANSETSLNPIANAIQGFKTSDPHSQTYVSNLASGGLFHFGSMLDGDTAANVRKLVANGVDHATILDSDAKIQTMLVKAKQAFDKYNEFSNRGEEMPRTALYAQLRAKGVSHAEASLQARDLLDYSLQGSWPAIRMIAQTVPFMNARAQGLYKLGRAGFENPARMATVLGALSLASVGLMAANQDDPDMKKREDFDVDNFWGFKIGDTIYRIPKPFELGAAATLAERTVQSFTDPEMTSGRMLNIVASTIGNQLNMNPIPQAVKPILDLYANKDSFTGRPIETDAMRKLQPADRVAPSTSLPARVAGSAMQATADALGLTAAGVQGLSPVQIDHLVGGYFGWLGSSAVTAADMITRPMTDVPSAPTPDYLKMATGQLAAQSDSGQSRYITEFYDQARVMQQALATYQSLVKEGKVDEARDFMADNAKAIVGARTETGVSAELARINSQIRLVQGSQMDPDAKRDKIIELRDRESDLAQRVVSAAQ